MVRGGNEQLISLQTPWKVEKQTITTTVFLPQAFVPYILRFIKKKIN